MQNQEVTIIELKYAVQALSLDADGQLSSFPKFVVVTDELLLEFSDCYKVAVSNYPEWFTEDQLKILKEIDVFIKSIEPEDNYKSIEMELRTSPFWEELRNLARNALIKFNWPSELPPLDRAVYIEG